MTCISIYFIYTHKEYYTMGIKTFETRNSLKNKLHNRNLIFSENELDEILISHNYFNLFNGLETIFLESSSPKLYNKVQLTDFINLYQFDKEIRSILSNCLDSVEEKLKASIAYHFCKHHCVLLTDTMQYTNKVPFMDPANNVPGTPTYCRYSNAYPFVGYQNQKIYQEFDKFCLFKPFFLSNLVDRNDHIDISFYFDSAYVAPSGVAVYRDSTGTYNKNVAVPFWVAIETLTFGEILRLLHYLQDDVLKDVLNDFNLPLSKRAPFLNMIDILLCLRNNCAHTTLLNRFRTEKRYRINTLLITSFSLTPKNADSVLKLYDSIKILSFFTDVTALRKPLKILKFKMYTNMGIKKGKTTYNKLLARMGCGDYKKWNTALFKTKYFL